MLAQAAAILALTAFPGHLGGGLDHAQIQSRPIAAAPTEGLSLWRGAQVGMSMAQVRALFPAAVSAPKTGGGSGADREGLRLPNVDLGGSQATARLFFRDDELISVEVTLNRVASGHTEANERLAASIARNLTQQYGSSYDCGDQNFWQVSTFRCKWIDGRLSIQLWYMDVAGQAPTLYVSYRQIDDPGYAL